MSSHVKSLFAVLGVSALALTSCAADNGENGGNEDSPDTADTAGGDSEAEGADDSDAEAASTECRFAPEDGEVTATQDQDTLAYWADELDIRIGNVAAGGGHHEDEDYPDPFPDDEQYRDHLAAEYTSLTHENYLKWEFIHPNEWGEFHFEEADAVVELAQANGMDMRGHALFWHSQNPEWLEEGVENGEFSEDELREMLEEHVRTVVSRYAGCIQQWDLANEIFDDDEEPQLRDGSTDDPGNIWIRELGIEILDDVFEWAHEEDPDALLFYNDYNVDGLNAKADAYHDLIQEQLDRGVPVHGFGAQTHLSMLYGFDDSYQENLQRFSDLGLHTAVTEIDVRGEVDDEDSMSQEDRAGAAERFETTLQACLEVEDCDSYTVWGTLDEHSWVPGTFEGEGDATLHEGDYERKPSYCVLQRTLVDAAEGEGTFDEDPTFEECAELLSDYGV